MTTQPEAGPSEGTPATEITKPWRELIALVLVGANAVLLLVGLIDLLIPYSENIGFSSRAGGSFFDFVGIEAIVLPLLAVLLATHIKPAVPRAKLITQIALVEYAVSAVFGVVALLAWLFGSLVDGEIRAAFTGLLVRIAYSGIFAAAGFVIYKVWRTLYYVPRPKPQPGVYGGPPGGGPGYPPAGPGHPGPQGPTGGYGPSSPYSQPPGYGPQPGYPPPPTYPGSPQPPGYGAPGPGPGPGGPGQSAAAPGGATRPSPTPHPGVVPPGAGAPQGAWPPAGGPQIPTTGPIPHAPTSAGYADESTRPITASPTSGPPSAQPAGFPQPTSAPPAPGRPSPQAAVAPHHTPSAPNAAEAPVLSTTDTDRTQLINPASQQPSAGTAPPPVSTGDEPTRPDLR